MAPIRPETITESARRDHLGVGKTGLFDHSDIVTIAVNFALAVSSFVPFYCERFVAIRSSLALLERCGYATAIVPNDMRKFRWENVRNIKGVERVE